MVHKRITDRKGRYTLREIQYGDYYRLRQMNLDLFFAPLRHDFGPVGYLQAAMKQQKDPQRTDYFMGVADARNNQLIGSIMVFNRRPQPDGTNAYEIGYFIDPLYQRIHFATDATVDLLQQLRGRLNISKVTATVDPTNVPSRKILRRLGFKHTGLLRESQYKANPDLPESYDAAGHLKHAPRLQDEVTIQQLFDAAKQVLQPDPAVVAQRLQDARRDILQRELRADQVSRNLARYLATLRRSTPRNDP